MKSSFLFATLILLATSVPALAQHGHGHGKEEAKTVALTGEVIDLTCFMQHPANAVGMDHAKCAKACINKGLPVGFRDEDGTMYLLIGGDHEPIASRVADVVGRKVTINGVIIEHDGVKAVQLVSVAETK